MTTITSHWDGLRLESNNDNNVIITAEVPTKVPIDSLISELFSLKKNAEAKEKSHPHQRSLQAPYNQLAG
jgi:hypothetical protein